MMDARDRREAQAEAEPRSRQAVQAGPFRVLAVALSEAALTALPRHVLQPDAEIQRITLEHLPDALLTGPEAPVLVLSPLLTAEFDVLDLARMLAQCGYRGRYLALVDKLPSATLIRREVEAQSPTINFDVIVLDGTTPIHSL
jgi:hypothetical protein